MSASMRTVALCTLLPTSFATTASAQPKADFTQRALRHDT